MAVFDRYPRHIARWRRSTAFIEMTLAQQGAYWNLIDEAVLRGGYIPNDPKLLAKACGDPLEWPEVGEKVLRWFRLEQTGWTNDTVLEVIGAMSAEEKQLAAEREYERTRKRSRRDNNRDRTRDKGGDILRDNTRDSDRTLPHTPSVNKSKSVNREDLSTEQNRSPIDVYNTIFGTKLGYTPGNLKASNRAFAEGYTLEQMETVFKAVKARSTEQAAWCDEHNREFEYLIRPPYIHNRTNQLTQGPMDKILNELATGRRA